MRRVSGTEGYAEEAEALIRQYESISFAEAHASILHLLPAAPGRVVDIGAGTGRDAAGFAGRGYDVLAVEPTDALRERAAALHPSPSIEWLNDSLPELALAKNRGPSFDIVMLTAVWMHLDEAQRRAAMPVVASLVRPGGVLFMSLRHGPVPPGRRMFAVPAEETPRLARARGLELIFERSHMDSVQKRPGVSWTRLGFARPARAAR